MSELAELKGAVKTIRRIVAELEPGCVRGDDASGGSRRSSRSSAWGPRAAR